MEHDSSNPTLKTSAQWLEIINAKDPDDQLVILDPDGWDRRNYQFSFHEELITELEFHKRAGMSTQLMTPARLTRFIEKYGINKKGSPS